MVWFIFAKFLKLRKYETHFLIKAIEFLIPIDLIELTAPKSRDLLLKPHLSRSIAGVVLSLSRMEDRAARHRREL